MLLLAAALLAACGHDRAEGRAASHASDDGADASPLPAPAATPGTSITGMPTSPPPPKPVDAAAPVEPAPSDPAAAPAPDPALPAPVDEVPAPTGAEPPATPAMPPPDPADAAAAGAIVQQYLAAVASGALARAQALWSATPNDSAVLQLARGAPFDVSIGGPALDAGGRVSVPVDVRGRGEDGAERHVQVTYTVQRAAPSGPWRIAAAVVRDAAP